MRQPVHGETGLHDADGVALGGEGIESSQTAFEDVERAGFVTRD
jgi:hypothetical protein